MKCPKCQTDVETLYPHPDGYSCFACCADANLGKLSAKLAEFFQSLPEKPLQDLAKAETIKAYSAGAGLVLPPKPATQISMYKEIAPHFETQFLTATKGAVGVDYTFNTCALNPKREMEVGYFDRQREVNVMHAAFSCS